MIDAGHHAKQRVAARGLAIRAQYYRLSIGRQLHRAEHHRLRQYRGHAVGRGQRFPETQSHPVGILAHRETTLLEHPSCRDLELHQRGAGNQREFNRRIRRRKRETG